MLGDGLAQRLDGAVVALPVEAALAAAVALEGHARGPVQARPTIPVPGIVQVEHVAVVIQPVVAVERRRVALAQQALPFLGLVVRQGRVDRQRGRREEEILRLAVVIGVDLRMPVQKRRHLPRGSRSAKPGSRSRFRSKQIMVEPTVNRPRAGGARRRTPRAGRGPRALYHAVNRSWPSGFCAGLMSTTHCLSTSASFGSSLAVKVGRAPASRPRKPRIRRRGSNSSATRPSANAPRWRRRPPAMHVRGSASRARSLLMASSRARFSGRGNGEQVKRTVLGRLAEGHDLQPVGLGRRVRAGTVRSWRRSCGTRPARNPAASRAGERRAGRGRARRNRTAPCRASAAGVAVCAWT